MLDFGLARSADGPNVAGLVEGEPTASAVASEAVTQFGTVVGTPRYMAPEQHRGEPIDARTDVYSFCVSLFEALYDRLPWDRVKGEGGLARAKVESAIVVPPRKGVPRRVRRTLERGLSASKERRPQSMALVIAELAAQRRAWMVAAGGGVLAMAVAGALLAMSDPPDPCAAVNEPITRIWNDEAAQSVDAAIRKSGLDYAPATADTTLARVEQWAAKWSAARAEACEATHHHGAQSAALFDLRMACLDARLSELEQLVRSLKAADDTVVAHATDAAAALTDVSTCSAAMVMAGRSEAVAPTPEAIELEQRLGEVQTLDALGQLEPARKAANAALERARTLEDSRLQAKAFLSLAQIDHDTGRVSDSLAGLRSAIVAGERAGDVLVRARAWRSLGLLLGMVQHDLTNAQLALDVAGAILESVPDATHDRKQLEDARAMVLAEGGKPEEALPHAERALELVRASDDSDDLRLAASLTTMGLALGGVGRWEEAESMWNEALQIYESRLGPTHPRLAAILLDLGAAARNLRRPEDALEHYERALAMLRAQSSDEHPSTSTDDLTYPVVFCG